jgi:hypothetical protein
MKGVDEDELDGSHGTLSTQNKQPQPERHKSINVIECQYEREPFNDEDVLCKPDGDYEEDLYDGLMEIMKKIYMMMKILQTRT